MADYIVIGGGSTGCVVASRLSENTSVEVVLFEEGPRDISPYIHIPGAYYKTAQGSLLKRYSWEPTKEQARTETPSMVQASVLGGGSSVNAMIYIRGVPSDYDSWAAAGAKGWSYKDVLPYFKRAEDNEIFCNDTHGVGGPLGVSAPGHIHDLSKVWLQACQQMGMPYNVDFNSGNSEGCGIYQITAKNGRRSSAAVAYLSSARARPNLVIKTKCKVTKILIENGKAVGVEYTNGKTIKTLSCRKEIIVSSGAINTPKLLMLSGVGPADQLKKHGIEVKKDLKGVGQNLQDHIEISLIYKLAGPFSYDKYKKPYWKFLAGLEYLLFKKGPASSNLIEGGAFWWANKNDVAPDLQFFMVVGAGIEEGVEAVPGGNGCTVNLGQIRPKSRGYVRLRSANPDDQPIIVPNYFSDPYDLECLTDGFIIAQKIMAQKAFGKYIDYRHTPDQSVQSRDDVRRFCQENAHAALHPSGTCRMGVDDMSVVDPELRVHGIAGLRVADASIMPTLISGNPNAVCIMIGEKAADLILGKVLKEGAEGSCNYFGNY